MNARVSPYALHANGMKSDGYGSDTFSDNAVIRVISGITSQIGFCALDPELRKVIAALKR